MTCAFVRPQCFTLKFVSLSERENWLNMYESALAIPLSIFLGMHSLRPLNPVTRLLEMHEALERCAPVWGNQRLKGGPE